MFNVATIISSLSTSSTALWNHSYHTNILQHFPTETGSPELLIHLQLLHNFSLSLFLFIVPIFVPRPTQPYITGSLPISPTSCPTSLPFSSHSVLNLCWSDFHPTHTLDTSLVNKVVKQYLLSNSQFPISPLFIPQQHLVLSSHLGRLSSLGLHNTFLSWVSSHLSFLFQLALLLLLSGAPQGSVIFSSSSLFPP